MCRAELAGGMGEGIRYTVRTAYRVSFTPTFLGLHHLQNMILRRQTYTAVLFSWDNMKQLTLQILNAWLAERFGGSLLMDVSYDIIFLKDT